MKVLLTTTVQLSFLSNKAQLHDLLNQNFDSDDHTVKKCHGDADTFIDATSMYVPVIVIADDTNILLMLLFSVVMSKKK